MDASVSRRAEKLRKMRKWHLKKQLRPRFLKRRSFDPRSARHFVEAIAFVVLVMCAVTAGAQERRIASENDGKRSSELAKDNLDRVAASEPQIAGLLSANPGLLVELKRWMAKDASDKGQIVQDEDLEDAAIFHRLHRDANFRAAATRLLQRYGYLLPTLNPSSEAGKEDEDLRKERIRQRAAAELKAPAESSGINRPAHANCDPTAVPADSNCEKQAGARVAENETDVNPTALPRDRDSDRLLINRGAETGGTNPGLSRTGANERDRGDGGLGTNLNSGQSESESGTDYQSGYESGQHADRMHSIAESDLKQPSRATSMPSSERLDASADREEKRKRGAFEIESADMAGPPGTPRHWTPYSEIPSVYDMFVHASAPTGAVERFGEEVFRNPPKASGNIPIDFPASPDYVVGPGDGLAIDLWGGVSQRLERTVDHEGRLSLPEVGPVAVNGQTLSEVQQTVQRLLRTQFRDVAADVSLSRLRKVRVYVVGDVKRAGAYDVSSLSTPLNALLAAGGPTANGSMRIVKHFRGSELVQEVDLYDLLLRGVRTDIQRLEPGDTLLVPPVGSQIRVDGMVRRPAIYELHKESTLAQALEMAGGILPTASLSHIEVQRLEAHDKRTMLSLEISGAADPAEIESRLKSFAISDRDEIHIFSISQFNQDAIYLEGHVLRPGRYAFKPGMKVTDLISSYGDVLPEPALKYAEIIRLNPPDFQPSIESFNLSAALSNPSAAPALQALDTVRIFNRFELESPPTISVAGAVRKPGTFEPPGQIHFRDAIELSGGLRWDASMDSAQIVRVTADGSLKILSVRVKEALEGGDADNVLLEPRDRVLIQQNLNHVDPPSVLVGGEVIHPGRYLLTGNLHVSDLVQIAGGLSRGADTESADLTQYQASNTGPLVATHADVQLAAAMAGNPEHDTRLRDGDVLTIRQVRGWTDLRAVVHIDGEAQHPGTYGIHPGERLSSVLERAGGFEPDAYAYGAVFERIQVRELEAKERDAMLLRLKQAQDALELSPDGDPKQKVAKGLALQQWQTSIDELNANPPVGRVSIRISGEIERWKNTSADLEVRAGDTLVIPKKPGFVMVSGQAFNPTAISYRPGRSASWYLSRAGGPTPMANKKGIFVIRANGTVIGGRSGLWSGDSLSAALQPGDIVVVPEKALAGNVPWQNILLLAQVVSSIALTTFIAVKQ
jgi:polysaccharide export outer membrane protein